jgi:hypothetical protein
MMASEKEIDYLTLIRVENCGECLARPVINNTEGASTNLKRVSIVGPIIIFCGNRFFLLEICLFR